MKIMRYDWELKIELEEHKNDKSFYENELLSKRVYMSELLKGEMGKDINDVLEGKIIVKLSWKERLKYKIKFYLTKLFELI